MIEFILGVYFSWWFIIGMFCIIPIAYHNEYEVAGLIVLGLLGLALYSISNISLITLGLSALAYIPLGIFYSIFRWKRRGDDIVEEILSIETTSFRRGNLIESLKPENNISYIASLILGWPFSALENLLSDIFISIKNLIKDYLIDVYSRITANHMSKIK